MKNNGIKQIAKKAGCSCSTVSRALNNRNRISSATRKKILTIAEHIKYISPPGRQTVIVLAYFDVDGFNFYGMYLLNKVLISLRKAGFKIKVSVDSTINLSEEQYFCGVISLLPYGNIAKTWGKKRALPLVCINNYGNTIDGLPSVCSDEKQAVYEAINYLYSNGHRSIVFLLPNPHSICLLTRLQAFEEHTEFLGIKKQCKIIQTANRFLGRFPRESDIKRIPKSCTALISADEAFCNRTCFLLQKMRPDIQPLLWTFPQAENYPPYINPVMIQNYNILSETAVRMLRDKIIGKTISNNLVPYEFIVPKNGSIF